MKGRQPQRDGATAPATEIGPYRLGGLLGRGGMGEVYRAFDDRLERWVAVKRLRDRRSSGSSTSDRLRHEAKVLARLGHPAIVQIFDIVEDDAQDWIVMELIEGPTLAELCRDQPVAVPLVTHYARQIASALGAAHDRGIVHRDLKTENVMALPTGHVKVLDFGLAQETSTADRAEVVTHRGATVSLPGRIVGTPRSMSPEQALGAEIDARSDLFSLGVLLYEITTGRSPFTASTIEQMVQRILRHEPRPLHHAAGDVPMGLSRLVHELLEKDPALRPASAEAVEATLAALDVPDVVPASVTLGLSQLATVDETSGPEDTGSAAADTVVITTLLVTDLPDATSLVETLGDAEAATLFRRHDRAARDLLETHGGREIDRSDGFLLLFERPWTAIRYALDYHRCSEALGLRARVGIHLGEVVLHQNTPHDIELGARPVEIDGLARPVANLLVGLANDGQTLLTRAAYDVTRRSAVDLDGEALEWREHGSYHFVGVGEAVDVFEIGIVGRAPLSAPVDSERAWRLEPRADAPADIVPAGAGADARRSRRLAVVVLGALVALLVIAAVVASRLRSSSTVDSSTVEPRAVAVMLSAADTMRDDDAARLFAFTARHAARRALVDLDGITVRAQSAVDVVDAGPRDVAMAVAADEIVGIELACAGNDCLIELSRLRGADGVVLAATQARAPRHHLLVAASAVHLAVRELYPDHPTLRRLDVPEVAAERYAEYVDLLHRLTSRPDAAELSILLDEVAELRARAPTFPEAA
ncbi:MAG: protein kinase, partial [Acidobacteriota bacterium]